VVSFSRRMLGRKRHHDWSKRKRSDRGHSRESGIPYIVHGLHENGLVAHDDIGSSLHGVAFDRRVVITLFLA